MFENYHFSIGQNDVSIEIFVDLNRLKPYHTIVESYIEIANENGKSSGNFRTPISFTFKIDDKIELENFNYQLRVLIKQFKNTDELNNILFLAKQIFSLEAVILKEQYSIYEDMFYEFSKLHKIIEYGNFDELDIQQLKIQFITGSNSVKDNIEINSLQTKGFLFAWQNFYTKYLLEEYKLFIIEILGKPLYFETCTFGDILKLINLLKLHLDGNVEKNFRKTLFEKVIGYVRYNCVFGKYKGDELRISSKEARLLYILYCLLNFQPVLSSYKGKIDSYITGQIPNYNSNITAKVKEDIIDLNKNDSVQTLNYTYAIDSKLFELFDQAINR